MSFKRDVQFGGQNFPFMLHKFTVTECTAPPSEHSCFSFDFAHLFSQTLKALKKDYMILKSAVIASIITWKFINMFVAE